MLEGGAAMNFNALPSLIDSVFQVAKVTRRQCPFSHSSRHFRNLLPGVVAVPRMTGSATPSPTFPPPIEPHPVLPSVMIDTPHPEKNLTGEDHMICLDRCYSIQGYCNAVPNSAVQGLKRWFMREEAEVRILVFINELESIFGDHVDNTLKWF